MLQGNRKIPQREQRGVNSPSAERRSKTRAQCRCCRRRSPAFMLWQKWHLRVGFFSWARTSGAAAHVAPMHVSGQLVIRMTKRQHDDTPLQPDVDSGMRWDAKDYFRRREMLRSRGVVNAVPGQQLPSRGRLHFEEAESPSWTGSRCRRIRSSPSQHRPDRSRAERPSRDQPTGITRVISCRTAWTKAGERHGLSLYAPYTPYSAPSTSIRRGAAQAGSRRAGLPFPSRPSEDPAG